MDLPRIEIVPNSPKTRNNWGNTPYNEFTMQIDKIYEEIVHMRRNIFKIPSGKAGKEYIKELTFWLRQFNSNFEDYMEPIEDISEQFTDSNSIWE